MIALIDGAGQGPWADVEAEIADLAWVLTNLPAGWKAAAEACVGRHPVPGPLEAFLHSDGSQAFVPVQPAAGAEAECSLVRCVGWLHGRRWVSVQGLTVKAATLLQLGPVTDERRRYVGNFVAECGTPADRTNAAVREVWVRHVFAAYSRLWRLPWDNAFKEVYWRLTQNGLATSARLHRAQPCGACGCQPAPGGPLIGRRHHFWECPVAQAVVQAVQQQLPQQWCVQPLQPHNLLFMHRPAGASRVTTVHAGVWRVVCLAAVNAMDVGRRAAAQAQVEGQQAAAAAAAAAQVVPRQQQAEGQQRLTDVWQPAPLAPHQQQHQQQVQQRQQARQQQQQQRQQEAREARLAEVKVAAVARFWELLQDFVVMNAAPPRWGLAVAPNHPLLRSSRGLAGLRVLAVVQPPAG